MKTAKILVVLLLIGTLAMLAWSVALQESAPGIKNGATEALPQAPGAPAR